MGGPEPDDEVEKIKRDFIASLSARMQIIREGTLQPPSSGDAAFEKSRLIVHQIRGVGAALGLPDLSRAATEAEEAMLRYPREPTDELWRTITSAIARMNTFA